MTDRASGQAASLSCWSAPVTPEPIGGGISNRNFKVVDRGRPHFVRIGDDNLAHGVLRWHELAASRAADAAGISPAVIHHEPGALVLKFVDGKTLSDDDVRRPETLARILALVGRAHQEILPHFQGPLLSFWVFQRMRDYALRLAAERSRLCARLPSLMDAAGRLERAIEPARIVFGHHDLLAANFIDDGERLWLYDWEYGALGTPLFDLANLASNNGLDRDGETAMLQQYFGCAPEPRTRRSFEAMKCASLLREAMWSMVSETHVSVDFDYVAYTDGYLDRFQRAYDELAGELGASRTTEQDYQFRSEFFLF